MPLLRSSEKQRWGSANCSPADLLVDLVLALACSDSVFTTRPSLLNESEVNHGSPRNFTAVLPPRSPFVSLLRHTLAWEFQGTREKDCFWLGPLIIRGREWRGQNANSRLTSREKYNTELCFGLPISRRGSFYFRGVSSLFASLSTEYLHGISCIEAYVD